MSEKSNAIKELSECVKANGIRNKVYQDIVSAALHDYAEMVERCERIKTEQPFDSVINTANYILRGDAGKEER